MSINDGLAARPSPRRLYRDPERAQLAGVCAGIADYFGINATMVRVLMALGAVVFTVPTLLGYAIAWAALPRRPAHMYRDAGEAAFWRSVRLEPSRTARDLARKFHDLERRLRQAEAKVTSSEFKLRRRFEDLER